MRIFFVRHGQSENNALWASTQTHHGRVPDPELTELGKRQIVYAAQFLDYCLSNDNISTDDPACCAPESGVTYLFCSLMERSIQSGMIIAERLNLPLVANMEIHETGGVFQYNPETEETLGLSGNTPADLQARYPQLRLPKNLNSDGWWNKPFEKSEESSLRAKRLVATMKERHNGSGDTIILISHGGFYNHFMWEILGIQRPEHAWFELYNGAITLIHYENGGASIVYCNHYSFIPPGQVT